MLNKIKQFILNNKLLTGVFIFYFILRLINLTKLPIFNDEAIYLDWGYKELNTPGQLFLSLYDAKQPLLMWIFGFFEIFFSDPLFAGRLVSVLTGFISLIGIYKLTKTQINKNAAILACFLYTIIPTFSFYDRQALMESAIGAVGIWSVFFLIKFFQNQSRKNALLLGLTLGIGFFIKSSALIFILTTILISLFYLLKKNAQRKIIFARLFQSFLVFLAVDLLLFVQGQFWQTYSSNSRYSLTLTEIIKFPISIWVSNFLGNVEIPFFFITPLIFISAIIGIIMLIKNENENQQILVFWFLIALVIQTLVARGTSQRYIVSFLPPLVIFASFLFVYLYNLAKQRTVILVFCCAIIPFLLTMEQLLFPDSYIYSFANLPGAQLEYMTNYTSGQVLGNVISFLKDTEKYGNIIIATAQNAGNPENAVSIYFEKDTHAKVVYFDGRFIPQLDKIDCLTSSDRFYFVSRDMFLTNLNKFLDKVTEFHLPGDPSHWIGIWTLKTPCKGVTVNLNLGN